MIYFRFSLGSSGKMEIGSLDLLDDPILLEEIEDDVLTSVLEVLPELVSFEELLLASRLTASLGVVDTFTSGKIFLLVSRFLAEISGVGKSSCFVELSM